MESLYPTSGEDEVDKPFQRGLFVTDGEGWKQWVYFRYEKLLIFAIGVVLLDILRKIAMAGMGW